MLEDDLKILNDLLCPIEEVKIMVNELINQKVSGYDERTLGFSIEDLKERMCNVYIEEYKPMHMELLKKYNTPEEIKRLIEIMSDPIYVKFFGNLDYSMDKVRIHDKWMQTV